MAKMAGETRLEVERLLAQGRREEALTYLQSRFTISASDAERLVSSLERPPNAAREAVKMLTGNFSGCLVIALRALAVLFCFFAFGFLLSAGVLYLVNTIQVSESDMVEGHIVDFKYNEDGSAPVVEYIYNSNTYQTPGSTYSSPQAYTEGEFVQVFVSREEPNKILIDSFTERWEAIVISAAVALFFLVPAIALFVVAARLRRRTRLQQLSKFRNPTI